MKIRTRSSAVVLAVMLLLTGCSTDTEPVDNGSTKTTTTTLSGSAVEEGSSQTGTTTGTNNASGSTTGKVPAGTTTTSGNKSNGNKKTTATRATTTTRPSTSTSIIIDIFDPVTIKVACMNDSFFADESTMWGKRIAEELDAVEKELRCNIKVILYDSASLTEECIKAHTAGSKFADIMVTTMWQQRTLVKARALTDLNSLSGLNLSKAYWDQTARRDMQMYGKNFIGYTTLEGPSADVSMIYFNKKLAQTALAKAGVKVASPEAAAKELYQMVDNGKWTFDQMQLLSQKAKADLNGDGRMHAQSPIDQYGFSGIDMRSDVAYNIFKAKGGYFTKKSSNGDVIYALDDAINVTALKTMQTWLLKDDSVYNTAAYGTSAATIIDAFKAGRVLFLGYSADAAFDFADMKDWGMLPYPSPGSTTANGVYTTASNWNVEGFSIPAKVKGYDQTNAVIVLDAIARHLQTVRQEKDAYLASNVYSDTDSARMVKKAVSNLTVDFVQFGDLGSGGMSSIQYVFDSTKNDPAQRVTAVFIDTVKVLNEYLKAVK